MISLSPQDAIELPVDELALQVLKDISANSGAVINEQNYCGSYVRDSQGGWSINQVALEAISEAINWLHAHGLIAKDYTKEYIGESNAIIITRSGKAALSMSVNDLRSIHRIEADLHPLLQTQVRRQFLLGEYENAIFGAMRAVEIRVRSLGNFGNEVIGVDLMTRAFKAGGPLADPGAPLGEVEGLMALFRGTYAVLRNPSGHREVSFDDVTEASEAVMTANLLMRILDRIEKRIKSVLAP